MSSAFSSCKLASVLSAVLCNVFPCDPCSPKLWSDSTGISNWTRMRKKFPLSKMHTKAYFRTLEGGGKEGESSSHYNGKNTPPCS